MEILEFVRVLSKLTHIKVYSNTFKRIKLEELLVNRFVTAAVTVSMLAQCHYIRAGLSAFSPSTGNKPDTTSRLGLLKLQCTCDA